MEKMSPDENPFPHGRGSDLQDRGVNLPAAPDRHTVFVRCCLCSLPRNEVGHRHSRGDVTPDSPPTRDDATRIRPTVIACNFLSDKLLASPFTLGSDR